MKHIKHLLLSLSIVVVILILSACGSTTSGNGSKLTVLQVLQNSANAMNKLKSAHMDVTINAGYAGSNATSATGSTQPGVTYTIKGTGDESLPGQEELHINTGQSTLTEIVQDNKLYIQNAQGQWYVLDKSSIPNGAGNLFSSIDVSNLNSLLLYAQHAQLTDNGDQSLNGQTLRHITVTLDKNGLQQILNQNGQLAGLIGQQNVDAIINNTKAFKSTLDLWIDESNFYIHRTELKLNMTSDLSSLSGSMTPTAGATPQATPSIQLPTNATISLDSILDLSNFNVPVTITPPANATPTTNPINIFTGTY